MAERLIETVFLERAELIHGSCYDYSQVAYINSKQKVRIICPEHGVFDQQPRHHLNGCGCPDCGYRRMTKGQSYSTATFIELAVARHGACAYDYSQVIYVNMFFKVIIRCPVHGVFMQTPANHINRGAGCSACGRIRH